MLFLLKKNSYGLVYSLPPVEEKPETTDLSTVLPPTSRELEVEGIIFPALIFLHTRRADQPPFPVIPGLLRCFSELH